jgi:hypothetical protein
MKSLMYISLVLLIAGCSGEDDAGQQASISKFLEGDYNMSIKHFDKERSVMLMSEIVQVNIKRNTQMASSFNLSLYENSVVLKNVQKIENVMVFNMDCLVEGLDDFGNKYILSPYAYYDVHGKMYPGYFEIVNGKMVVFMKKEYVDQKYNRLVGYVDMEALKL